MGFFDIFKRKPAPAPAPRKYSQPVGTTAIKLPTRRPATDTASPTTASLRTSQRQPV